MTEPLIDRDTLDVVIWRAYDDHQNIADRVIAYLRTVLTPEALEPLAENWRLYTLNGYDLHGRIFGED